MKPKKQFKPYSLTWNPRFVLSGDGLMPPSGNSDCSSYVWSRVDSGGATTALLCMTMVMLMTITAGCY